MSVPNALIFIYVDVIDLADAFPPRRFLAIALGRSIFREQGLIINVFRCGRSRPTRRSSCVRHVVRKQWVVREMRVCEVLLVSRVHVIFIQHQ